MNNVLIVFDIDGTLTCEDDISNEVYNILDKLSEKAKISFVTGRTKNTFSNLSCIKRFLTLPYGLLNGGLVYDSNSNLINENIISKSDCRNVLETLSKYGHYNYHIESRDGFYVIDSEDKKWEWAKKNEAVYSLPSEGVDNVYKITIHAIDNENTVKQIANDISKELSTVIINNNYIDITNKNTNKGKVVNIIKDCLDREDLFVISCGNAWNDVEMFKVSDLSILIGNDITIYEANFNFSKIDEALDFLLEYIEENN